MIYLDNAATSFPKPEVVYEAVEQCLRYKGANPSRSGHKLSLKASQVVLDARNQIAELFKISDPLQVVFTANATEALNLGIKGILKPGDHVITSSMEHNSVTRPLAKLAQQGVEVTKLPGKDHGRVSPQEIAEGIKENTKLIVLSHASNVTGLIQPIDEIGKVARQKGILFMVDSAQTAGSFEIDVDSMNIDLLVFAGHKGLLGPQGTGGLYIRPDLQLDTLKEGGTGSNSESPLQPEESPERYESGTLNTPGLAGLGKGVEFILQVGLKEIREKERKLTLELMEGLKEIPGVKIYGDDPGVERAPVVSFNIEGKEPSHLAFLLDQVFDIASRPGLHCAPDAHRTLGTFPYGTLRLSPGYFNTSQEMEKTLEAIAKLI